MEKLTNKEEEIMHALWKVERAFVKDLMPFFTNPPLHYNTVSTIIRNLEEKGYIGHRTYGNTYEYYPLVSKESYQNQFVISKLVDNYFDNSYKNLVSYFAQNDKVSADELREILRMIEGGSDT
ncbi:MULTISPECIES: BlaI/MecI/CopY family transcriptional regulator [Runella]|jgi:predicted transcriptional regulator|uniref:Putative transcriptional regulator n=1 Tax=Runella defluvii TaxID=370973 RepID=A0A7W6ENJ0_9BACT|nr:MULTISPECIES: BlaI/MecI/CopY family transcriptional regulator [Runella]AYQ30898.1 BlaI/MecI/CopY family transcriptional regulator [Runella sp. SP2]MBB3836549.1 putative transcriptional regulator [Runella defluvii]